MPWIPSVRNHLTVPYRIPCIPPNGALLILPSNTDNTVGIQTWEGTKHTHKDGWSMVVTCHERLMVVRCHERLMAVRCHEKLMVVKCHGWLMDN